MLLHVILSAGAILMVMPFVWMISTSLKTLAEAFILPPQWIPLQPQWSTYVRVTQEMPFFRYLFNTACVSVTITLGHLLICSLSAYAFARLRFPGKNVIFLAYLATLMIPGQVLLIPSFILIRYLGWLDTYQALIVPMLFSAFGIFLLRQFFLTLPNSLDEAAVIDGANPLQVYWHVLMPLARPALATLGIFSLLASWNNLLWPLIVTSRSSMRVLTVGLATLQGEHATDWPVLMAGALLSTLPLLVLFFLAQRYFVAGIALSGLKG